MVCIANCGIIFLKNPIRKQSNENKTKIKVFFPKLMDSYSY